MTWNCQKALDKRAYNNTAERGAFRNGYSDGYHKYPKYSGNEHGWYVNAYSAGYWEGTHDGT